MSFWLSHHADDELDRCYRIGGVAVCARCLGTYPVLFAAFALGFAAKWPLSHPWDVPLATALVVPATLDWAWGRFKPHDFGNAWRSLTGALAGAGLGRALFIHAQRPFPVVLLVQLAFVTSVALAVILATYLRRSRW